MPLEKDSVVCFTNSEEYEDEKLEKFTLDINVKNLKKYNNIVDGKMPILLSKSYQIDIESIRYDPKLISLMIELKHEDEKEEPDDIDETIYKEVVNKIKNYIKEKKNFFEIEKRWKNAWFNAIEIKWIPIGTLFRIEKSDNDGEFLITIQEETWYKA